jgi:hypothetical protein
VTEPTPWTRLVRAFLGGRAGATISAQKLVVIIVHCDKPGAAQRVTQFTKPNLVISSKHLQCARAHYRQFTYEYEWMQLRIPHPSGRYRRTRRHDGCLALRCVREGNSQWRCDVICSLAVFYCLLIYCLSFVYYLIGIIKSKAESGIIRNVLL